MSHNNTPTPFGPYRHNAIMPRARPQLSITLPRNFTFHYTEGQEPKTPEQETPAPIPQSPHAYRVKRRSRPNVSLIASSDENTSGLKDDPIPTIEVPISVEPIKASFQHQTVEPMEGYLAPVPCRRFMTSPRTPAPRNRLDNGWGSSTMLNFGESISRPMSACSIFSDSSDDSNGSLSSYPSLGGSCTSPESDAPDPFIFPSIRKGRIKSRAPVADIQAAIKRSQTTKQIQVRWTPEMDKHLWTAYLLYLQDPVVTPFKMLPGTAPPLGVCHRVAREARRTWRGAKALPRRPSDVLISCSTGSDVRRIKSGDSPDTIRADRSGSNTPTGFLPSRSSSWPKSGASTRRRLRELCKRKPTIAPHYQRLLQARSSSPESSNTHCSSQPLTSPFSQMHAQTPFDTRDIQLSLTTSTAASMQPDGPLAQMASQREMSPQLNRDWFNDPIVPWASPTEIPSDIGLGIGEFDDSLETPQLGSPFGYHTWGPSRSHQRERPFAPRTQSDAVFTMGPTLKSPVHLHDTFPYPSVQKRRAQHLLEDELSPGGSDLRKHLMEDLFGGPAENRHRRVRSRGFSLGDVNANGGRLESLFTPPSTYDELSSSEMAAATANPANAESLPSISDSVVRLGSPFAGVSARPPRRSSRHMATASLSAYDPGNFSSIDQTIGQANLDDDLRKRLAR